MLLQHVPRPDVGCCRVRRDRAHFKVSVESLFTIRRRTRQVSDEVAGRSSRSQVRLVSPGEESGARGGEGGEERCRRHAPRPEESARVRLSPVALETVRSRA